MHDPETLAFSLYLGRFNLLNVWHVDPCRGASDDSCGWTFPRLTTAQHQAMKDLGWWEGRERHYLRYPFKQYRAEVADREALYRAAILLVAKALRVRMSFGDASTMAAERFGVGGCEGPDRLFCFLPGYHTNHADDRAEDRADHWRQECTAIARLILLRHRRWWQHPRWHFWHWKLTFPGLRNVWLRSRS